MGPRKSLHQYRYNAIQYISILYIPIRCTVEKVFTPMRRFTADFYPRLRPSILPFDLHGITRVLSDYLLYPSDLGVAAMADLWSMCNQKKTQFSMLDDKDMF